MYLIIFDKLYSPKILICVMLTSLKDEIMKQEELMAEIDRSVLRPKGITVRYVLDIPEELFE